MTIYMSSADYEMEADIAELRREVYGTSAEHSLCYYSVIFSQRFDSARTTLARTLEIERENEVTAVEVAWLESTDCARETIKNMIGEWIARNGASALWLASIAAVMIGAMAHAVMTLVH